MHEPDWDDENLGAGVMARGALWLLQVVGEGNTFTKEGIRAAFPGVAQADRRIRDLRDYGWTLDTPSQDATLAREQTRFVAAGIRVWDPKQRRAANFSKPLANRERDLVLARDSYLCTVCGISSAEEYEDDPTQTAVLGVAKRTVAAAEGIELTSYVTTCKRCLKGRESKRVRVDRVVAQALELSEQDRAEFLEWADAGRRELRAVESLWGYFLRMPGEAQELVRNTLRGEGSQRPHTLR